MPNQCSKARSFSIYSYIFKWFVHCFQSNSGPPLHSARDDWRAHLGNGGGKWCRTVERWLCHSEADVRPFLQPGGAVSRDLPHETVHGLHQRKSHRDKLQRLRPRQQCEPGKASSSWEPCLQPRERFDPRKARSRNVRRDQRIRPRQQFNSRKFSSCVI